MSSRRQIPSTPKITSPSPPPSDNATKDYFPPQTRSKAERESPANSVEEHDPDLNRARSRSRSPQLERKAMKLTANGGISSGSASIPTGATAPMRRKPDEVKATSSDTSGLLSPNDARPKGFGSSYWRNLSRSPSPLGLIPIHREWRAFVHKHEVPRKVLHVSIGFIALGVYYVGGQTSQIHPLLLSLLIPILTADLIRFRWPAFNRLYIRVLGAFMRESEAHDRYNGVISYLAGLWATMYFCRKDVALVSVLLLSWCDTAASTFGRLWGKYTPRIRKGKSLAGSLAAFIFGVGSAYLFWGLIAPTTPKHFNQGVNKLAFQGTLSLPSPARDFLRFSTSQSTISGHLALAVLALACGLIVSVSEAIDIFDLDDNLTIPVLSGAGLGVFLWAFGSS